MQGVETGAKSKFMNTAFLCMAWYALLGKGHALKALEQLSLPISWPSQVSPGLISLKNCVF